MGQKTGITLRGRIQTAHGFSLLEVLLAVSLLAFLATGVAAVFSAGFQSLDVQADQMLLDSQLRSRMEVLIGTDFDSLADGSEIVTVRGKNYTITWSVVLADINGDSNPDSDAKQVTVSVTGLSGRSLTSILVDNLGRLGRI